MGFCICILRFCTCICIFICICIWQAESGFPYGSLGLVDAQGSPLELDGQGLLVKDLDLFGFSFVWICWGFGFDFSVATQAQVWQWLKAPHQVWTARLCLLTHCKGQSTVACTFWITNTNTNKNKDTNTYTRIPTRFGRSLLTHCKGQSTVACTDSLGPTHIQLDSKKMKCRKYKIQKQYKKIEFFTKSKIKRIGKERGCMRKFIRALTHV